MAFQTGDGASAAVEEIPGIESEVYRAGGGAVIGEEDLRVGASFVIRKNPVTTVPVLTRGGAAELISVVSNMLKLGAQPLAAYI
jgi:hypothetical protein